MVGLVFNIGGTCFRAARYHSGSTSISSVQRSTTPSHLEFQGYTSDQLRELLFRKLLLTSQEIFGSEEPDFISVAFAGPIDLSGNAILAPTILGDLDKRPLPLLEQLQRFFPMSRVYVLNDVTAAGYRYIEHGDEDLCILTVGSGIGSKIFIGGKPLIGSNFQGGELGHLRVDFSDDALGCDCGGLGHLASVASGRGVLQNGLRMMERQPEIIFESCLTEKLSSKTNIDNRFIVEAFNADDVWACDLIKNAANYLGQVIASVHLSTGVERFIIGGGFALALGEKYRKNLIAAAQLSCWEQDQDWDCMITLGESDDNDSLIGAGKYAVRFAR